MNDERKQGGQSQQRQGQSVSNEREQGQRQQGGQVQPGQQQNQDPQKPGQGDMNRSNQDGDTNRRDRGTGPDQDPERTNR